MKDQIEEMAQLMCEDCAASGTHCPTELCDDVVQQAQVLYNAGYRKQSEGAWITTRFSNYGQSPRGREIIYSTYTCDVCDKSNGRRKTKYCPNCGAKMKGAGK